jgi:hypothetical protein
MTIIEGNKLINDFMGVDIDAKYYTPIIHREKGRYHNSWDWLMPVLEKISNLKSLEKDGEWYDFTIQNSQISYTNYEVDSDFDSDNNELPKIYKKEYSAYIGRCGQYTINLGKVCSNGSESMIDAAWGCIVDFIKWYNENK